MNLRDYQQQGVADISAALARGDRPLYVLPTGGGKCLGKGTPVLTFSGTIKPVEEVRVGDLLIGPDSQPRRVLSICSGTEMLYRVTPTKGDPYVVNESHILSLKRTNENTSSRTRGGEIVNIPLLKYISQSKYFKHIHKGWRADVNFPNEKTTLPLNPYFLGVWLGDGHSRTACITTGDKEIKEYLKCYASSIGMDIRVNLNSEGSECVRLVAANGKKGPKTNPIILAIRQFGMRMNKHIPLEYKTSSRQNRLALLAGIIDTDGYYSNKGFDLCLKNETLLDDVIFIARSLGFSCYKSKCKKTCNNNGVVGIYYRCNINGPVDQVPCLIPRKQAAPRRQKKNVLVTGINVDPIGEGEYYGFEIDGPDRLFLLGDFTVTHNTVLFCHIARNYPGRVCILMHRAELIDQTSRAMGDTPHGIIQAGRVPNPYSRIQIASVQTLVNRLHIHDFDIVIVDEAHHTTAATYAKILAAYPHAALLGVTATPCRTDGTGLRDAGYTCLIQGPTTAELTAQGYLTPAKVYSFHGVDVSALHLRYGDYVKKELAALMRNPKIVGDAIEHYRRFSHGLPAIAFCVSVERAEATAADFRAAGYNAASIDGTKTPLERRQLIHWLRTGALDILTSCDLISEGVDVPVVSCGIMLRPTASLALWLQQMGRCLRPAPGKTHAIILDHVGNSLPHGLPDTPRRWSLDGVDKKSSDKEPGDVYNRSCHQCFRPHATAPICPYCGFVYPIQGRELEQVDGELSLLDAQWALTKPVSLETQARRACRTLVDFLELEKQRGYKPGWAQIQYGLRRKRA